MLNRAIQWRRACVVAAGLAMLAAACAPANHDEATAGDLSNDPAAPTPLMFNAGNNVVTGTVTSTAPADTRDFLTFTIAPGHALTALRLDRYRDLPGGGPGNRGFHAISTGPTSAIPSAATAGSFLGGDHVDGIAEGTDLLPALADAMPAGTGFTIPLGPGTYSYVIQQTGPQTSGYSLTFEVSGPHH
jgi:hypothetical protein